MVLTRWLTNSQRMYKVKLKDIGQGAHEVVTKTYVNY